MLYLAKLWPQALLQEILLRSQHIYLLKRPANLPVFMSSKRHAGQLIQAHSSKLWRDTDPKCVRNCRMRMSRWCMRFWIGVERRCCNVQARLRLFSIVSKICIQPGSQAGTSTHVKECSVAKVNPGVWNLDVNAGDQHLWRG
ncbi:unnamed protein product [Symbiodinium natans]|uniref:Uncharacterized protein n=1 Tax=Symbiodinium natans TaxID=878477 RepID=A0A812QFS9_9DINO|nr:unnamed protein product [Symbiodinium natans]